MSLNVVNAALEPASQVSSACLCPQLKELCDVWMNPQRLYVEI